MSSSRDSPRASRAPEGLPGLNGTSENHHSQPTTSRPHVTYAAAVAPAIALPARETVSIHDDDGAVVIDDDSSSFKRKAQHDHPAKPPKSPRLNATTSGHQGSISLLLSANDDLDDEDRVEVLLVIAPPSSNQAAEWGGQTTTAMEGTNERRGELGLARTETNSSNSNRTYSFLTSAYVQNLAEIAFTLLNDRRWTVGSKMELLFQWEYGDDLSVLQALSRRFVPPSKIVRPPCTCLLCRDRKATPRVAQQGSAAAAATPDSAQLVVEEEEDDRNLYLYCRLFYRKGPWFRIDDVYNRYYRPHSNKMPSLDAAAKENSPPCTQEQPESDHPPQLSVLIEEHVASLAKLVDDMVRLQRRGWIRCFSGEEECGKTVGLSLLMADERATILSKLGGGGAAKKQPSKQPPLVDNVIWKQMSTQKSVWASLGFGRNNTGKDSLLPVRKHVDELILEKLVRSMVQAAVGADKYLPPHISRSYSTELKSTIRKRFGNSINMCFCLREGPAQTLRRCARLYACATSGPGDMRGDGTNGWKSLQDNGIPKAPLSNIVPAPGRHTFCHLVHPGLAHRFGLLSSSFSVSCKACPVSEAISDEMLALEQVFYSIDVFAAWEQTVELRANVDYLLELNERLRYNERRRNRGLQPVGRKMEDATSTNVDFLKLGDSKALCALVGVLHKALGQVGSLVVEDVESSLNELAEFADNDCERILFAIALLCIRVLSARHSSIANQEIGGMLKRPWLRHMWFDACLAYILWDVIPLLERKSLYKTAVAALSILLYGKAEGSVGTSTPTPSTLAPLLLSRRARGKAYDRLIIDFNHLASSRKDESDTLLKQHRSVVVQLCQQTLESAMDTAMISFSSIRGLARRLKRPLKETVGARLCLESNELGLRLETPDGNVGKTNGATSKYDDWQPTTDRAVANALTGGDDGTGSRCAFVGFEDQQVDTDSLNVEELAMEFYRSGRLPLDGDAASGGGWTGWHDEGGHIRALFRVLCSAPILGVDWGCDVTTIDSSNDLSASVHLSPYQGSPFDLHVGFDCRSESPTSSFYYRRRSCIDAFLKRLAGLDGQILCDLVYESIKTKSDFLVTSSRKDPTLERDARYVRTLSMIAVGCGGQQLASIFRAMFFDYRHYSGGLPDLLLVRAYSVVANERSLLDLGDWVGETFAPEAQQKHQESRGFAMLADDEFLGCSKVGDSGGSRLTGRQPMKVPARKDITPIALSLPDKLELVYRGSEVEVECMAVEVKSSNDRLDPRQEDWLNILDRFGNARVCKFEDSRKQKGKTQSNSSNDGRSRTSNPIESSSNAGDGS